MVQSWTNSIIQYGERVGSFWARPSDVARLKNSLSREEPIFIREVKLNDQSKTLVSLLCTHGNSNGKLMNFRHQYADAKEVIEDTLKANGCFGFTPHPLYVLNCFNGRLEVQTVFKNVVVNKMCNYNNRLFLSSVDELNLTSVEGQWQQIFMFTKAVPTELRILMDSLEEDLMKDGPALNLCRDRFPIFFEDCHTIITKCASKGMYGYKAGFISSPYEDTYDTFVLLFPCSKIGALYSMHLVYKYGLYFVSIYDELLHKTINDEWNERKIYSPLLEINNIVDAIRNLWAGEY